MTKWEYKQVSKVLELKENYFVDWLNQEGQDGWEVFGYTQFHVSENTIKTNAIFKRKIEDEKVD